MFVRLISLTSIALTAFAWAAVEGIDLTQATVVLVGSSTSPERKAAEMLLDEVERRSGIR